MRLDELPSIASEHLTLIATLSGIVVSAVILVVLIIRRLSPPVLKSDDEAWTETRGGRKEKKLDAVLKKKKAKNGALTVSEPKKQPSKSSTKLTTSHESLISTRNLEQETLAGNKSKQKKQGKGRKEEEASLQATEDWMVSASKKKLKNKQDDLTNKKRDIQSKGEPLPACASPNLFSSLVLEEESRDYDDVPSGLEARESKATESVKQSKSAKKRAKAKKAAAAIHPADFQNDQAETENNISGDFVPNTESGALMETEENPAKSDSTDNHTESRKESSDALYPAVSETAKLQSDDRTSQDTLADMVSAVEGSVTETAAPRKLETEAVLMVTGEGSKKKKVPTATLR